MAPCRLLTILGLLASGVAPARADDVDLIPNATYQSPGGRATGQIQAESPTAVTIKPAAGAVQEIPVDQIQSITYTGQPASLPLAETREANGNLSEALDQYKAAAAQAAGKEFILQAAQFGQARVLANLAESNAGRIDEATALLDALVRKYPNSRHKSPALERLAELSLAKGDTARAARAAAELAAIPWAASRAAVLRARVLSRQGQHDRALAALDRLLAGAPKGSPRSYEARLARAEVLAAAAKFDAAESTVRDVIGEIPPEQAEFLAHAYNTLGDCLRAAGKPKDALFAYLHTDVLYDKDKEQHARALFQIGQLWRQLKQDSRADEVMGRLRQLYPQSPHLTASPDTP